MALGSFSDKASLTMKTARTHPFPTDHREVTHLHLISPHDKLTQFFSFDTKRTVVATLSGVIHSVDLLNGHHSFSSSQTHIIYLALT